MPVLMPTSSPRVLISAPPELPGIDRGVGLDEVLVVGEADVRAARRADDAGGHGLAQLKRAADRQHPLADLQLARIAPRHDRQAACTSIFSSAMSVVGSVPIDLARDLALVGQRDRDLAHVLADDVVVGDDVAVGRDDRRRSRG